MTHAVVVHPSPEALAVATAQRLALAILDAQSRHAPVHVGLTGGRIGTRLLSDLRSSPLIDALDLGSVHLWWGDERHLPAGDADRNATQAREAFLDAAVAELGLPEANIHEVPPADEGLSAEEAAQQYAETLAASADDGAVPRFDVLLLGVGPDSHVASLFPGHPALGSTGAAVAVHDSPKPPPTRVSLTFEAINAAAQVWLVVAGADKAEAVQAGLSGSPDAPCARVHGTSATLWLIDADAASALDLEAP